MSWFKFNNKSSLDFKTLIVNELPSIIKPAEKVNKYDLESRHGELILPTGYYSNMTKSVECTIKNISEIDEIISWLKGSGKVIFSNQEDRYYQAVIQNQIDFERVVHRYRKFIVQFECQPFGYLLEGEENVILTENNSIIKNIGSIESEPVISITGEGDVELTIGQSIYKINSIEDNIIIDTPLMEVYKGTEVQNRKMKSTFPTFPTGSFTMRWVGNVTSIGIKPNWRCL